MSFFDKIFKKDRESEKVLQKYTVFTELNGYRPVFHSWGGQIYESELVRAAIDARARHISKLEPLFYGSARPSLINKMKHAPNEWQTWSQFFYRASTILDVKNTCIFVPVFDADMIVTGYYPVLPHRCEIVEYNKEPWIRYKFGSGEEAAVELRLCAILTKYQYKHDFFGEDNKAMHPTIELLDYNRQGINEAVKNSGAWNFMAQADNFTDPDDLELERKRFAKKNLARDAENDGFILFPNTYRNVQQIKQAQYTLDAEQMERIQKNVYDYFGVNENVMQNAANGDELDAFFNGCVEPFAIQISEALTRAMFSLRERSNGAKFFASSNRLQYMSTSAKVGMAQQLLDRGVMTINEARALFNFAPVPNGDIRAIRGEFKNADALTTINDETVVTVEEPVEEPEQEEEENAGEE
jgi:hypothetical protein